MGQECTLVGLKLEKIIRPSLFTNMLREPLITEFFEVDDLVSEKINFSNFLLLI